MNRNRLFTLPFLLSIIFLFSFGSNNSNLSAQDPFVVVLDAGHGGHDPGNLGNGYLEKNIALNIVLRVGGILEQNPGIKVVYTRNDDTFVDLFVRGEIANKANADLFVSVHCDSHSSDAHGAGTFVLGLHANEQNFAIAKKENSVIYLEDNYASRYADYDINSPESVIGLTIMQEEFLDQSVALATAIQDNFSNKLKRKNRKVKQAGFIVLHQTFMPSVLVETGFLTNQNEGAYLNSGRGQSEMGAAIAEAILNYKMNALSNVGSSSVSAMPSAPDPENAVTETEVAEMSETPVEEEAVENSQNEINSTVVKTAEELPEVVNEPPPASGKEVAEMIEQAEKTAVEAITKKEEISEQSEELVAVVEEATKRVEVETPPMAEEIPEQKTEVVVTEVNEAGRPKIVKEEVKIVAEPEVVMTEPKEAAPAIETKVVEKIAEAPEVKEDPKPLANIEFRVQLMASGKNLTSGDAIFKGLGKISKEPYKSLYRYMYGSTGEYVKAQLLKKVADAKGFGTSFLVAYKDGVRIDVEEARKYASE